MTDTFHNKHLFPANFSVQQSQAPCNTLQERSLWARPLPGFPEQSSCLGFQRQNLSLGSGRDPAGSPLSCSHCHLVDCRGYWFSSNFHFSLGFLWQVHFGNGLLSSLPKGSWFAQQHLTPLLSSFMILMRVFFQETHISLFDLGASVRIFFFNTTLAF